MMNGPHDPYGLFIVARPLMQMPQEKCADYAAHQARGDFGPLMRRGPPEKLINICSRRSCRRQDSKHAKISAA
jgi:hypothetical protein